MTFNQFKIWLVVSNLLVALCGVSDGQEPLTPSEFDQLKNQILTAPYWYDKRGNKRTDAPPPPKPDGNLVSYEYADGYWAFRKGVPRAKNPHPWPTKENSTLSPEHLADLKAMASEGGKFSQKELDWAILNDCKATSWDRGWQRGQRDEKWRVKTPVEATSKPRRWRRK